MKVAIFAFQGELMCFAHAMINAKDMHARGWDVKLIFEGAATRLLHELNSPEKPFGKLYAELKEQSIIDCVCKACSHKMGSLEEAETQGLALCDELNGHPSMARYMDQGYKIITM
jgi:hypothetical protein